MNDHIGKRLKNKRWLELHELLSENYARVSVIYIIILTPYLPYKFHWTLEKNPNIACLIENFDTDFTFYK